MRTKTRSSRVRLWLIHGLGGLYLWLLLFIVFERHEALRCGHVQLEQAEMSDIYLTAFSCVTNYTEIQRRHSPQARLRHGAGPSETHKEASVINWVTSS